MCCLCKQGAIKTYLQASTFQAWLDLSPPPPPDCSGRPRRPSQLPAPTVTEGAEQNASHRRESVHSGRVSLGVGPHQKGDIIWDCGCLGVSSVRDL